MYTRVLRTSRMFRRMPWNPSSEIQPQVTPPPRVCLDLECQGGIAIIVRLSMTISSSAYFPVSLSRSRPYTQGMLERSLSRAKAQV
jgi:hypothetical protein